MDKKENVNKKWNPILILLVGGLVLMSIYFITSFMRGNLSSADKNIMNDNFNKVKLLLEGYLLKNPYDSRVSDLMKSISESRGDYNSLKYFFDDLLDRLQLIKKLNANSKLSLDKIGFSKDDDTYSMDKVHLSVDSDGNFIYSSSDFDMFYDKFAKDVEHCFRELNQLSDILDKVDSKDLYNEFFASYPAEVVEKKFYKNANDFKNFYNSFNEEKEQNKYYKKLLNMIVEKRMELGDKLAKANPSYASELLRNAKDHKAGFGDFDIKNVEDPNSEENIKINEKTFQSKDDRASNNQADINFKSNSADKKLVADSVDQNNKLLGENDFNKTKDKDSFQPKDDSASNNQADINFKSNSVDKKLAADSVDQNNKLLGENDFNAQKYLFLYKDGNKAFDLGKYEDAVKSYKKSIEINPSFEKVYYNLGLAYMKLNNTVDALDFFDKAISINPNYTQVYFAKSQVYSEEGRISDAKIELEKALNYDKNSAKIYREYGRILFLEKDYKNSLVNFKKSIELDSNSDVAYYNIAALNLILQDSGNAILNAQKAYAINKNSSSNNYMMGKTIFFKGDSASLTQVEEYLKKAILIDPNYIDAKLELSSLYIRQNKYDDALLILNSLKDSKNPYVFNNLSLIYNSRKDFDIALDFAEKAKGLDSKNPLFYYTKSMSYMDKQDFYNAKLEVERILNFNKDYAPAYRLLGQIYLHLGENKNARDNFNIYLEYQVEDDEIKNILSKLN